MPREERNMYRTAQQREWDNYSILDYAKKEGREAGLEEGREKGREEGALANRREIALEMVRNGYDIDSIVNITKLSKEQIQEL